MMRSWNRYWICSLFVFAFFFFPTSGHTSFWEFLFGEDPREDRESIFEAIKESRVGNVERLLAKGVLLEQKDERGMTPLLYQIEHPSYANNRYVEAKKILLLLIEHGADIEAPTPNGRTPLLLCCHYYAEEFAEILLERGANIEVRDERGQTPLMIAASNGTVDILKTLLKKGADKDAVNAQSFTALILAVRVNQYESVRELLKAGSTVDFRDANGITPLMHAAAAGYTKIVKILLSYYAKVYAQIYWDVPVFVGSGSYFTPHRISPDSEQTIMPAGSTAVDFAKLFDHREVITVLLDNWAKKDPSMEKVLKEWQNRFIEL